jgi:GNAT superfamily N-acetyltransferase
VYLCFFRNDEKFLIMQSDNFQKRRADREDVEQPGRLLESVCGVHADGCPDLFRLGGRKYNNESLARMIEDHSSLIYEAEDGNGYLMEHVFYQIICHDGRGAMLRHKTMYIDDLCVGDPYLGRGGGRALYMYVQELARREDCYNLTLNVWTCNPSAIRFYEQCGMSVYKMGMETNLQYQ